MDTNQGYLTKEEIDLIGLWINHPEIMEEEIRKKRIGKNADGEVLLSVKAGSLRKGGF